MTKPKPKPNPEAAPKPEETPKPPKDEKRGPGRPKGSGTASRGPKGAEAVRKKRKTADEIKDTRDAIRRYHEDQKKLVERYRKEHPGALIADPVDPFTAAKREKIAPEFFSNTLKGVCVPVYAGLDTLSSFPPDASFKACGELWSETSAHFEMSKYMILSAAIVTTVGLITPAVTTRLTVGPDSETGRGARQLPKAVEAAP